MNVIQDSLVIADRDFHSRLFTGTGKFASSSLMLDSLQHSGSELITLALKRLDFRQQTDDILQPLLKPMFNSCRILLVLKQQRSGLCCTIST